MTGFAVGAVAGHVESRGTLGTPISQSRALIHTELPVDGVIYLRKYPRRQPRIFLSNVGE